MLRLCHEEKMRGFLLSSIDSLGRFLMDFLLGVFTLRQVLLAEYTCTKIASPPLLFGVAVLACVITTLDGWLSYHFLHKTKNIYYCTRLVESIILLGLLNITLLGLKQRLKQTTWSIFSKLSNNWHFLIVYCLMLCIASNDFMQGAAMAGGSEFLQISIALSIPAVLIWNNNILSSETKGYTMAFLFSSSAAQVIILCKDKSFSSPVSTALYSAIFAMIHGLCFVLMKRNLLKEQIFHFMYLLVLCQIPVFLTLAILYGEPQYFFSYQMHEVIFKSFAMAVMSFLKMTTILLLLKISDPVTCFVCLNLSIFPISLIHAFIYKLQLYLSTLKVFFFLGFNAIAICFKERETNLAQRTVDETVHSNESKFHY